MAILIDFEATCWEKSERNKHTYSEIIEICAIAVNSSFEITNEFSELVKPTIEPVLSEFCIKLTGISQQDIDNSRSFNEVFRSFDDWVANYKFLNHKNEDKSIKLIAWGDYDQMLLRKNLFMNNYVGEVEKYYKRFYNLQAKFQKIKHISEGNCNLSKALAIIGETFEGKEHRGLDDAKNMLKVYKYLCSVGEGR